MSEAMKPKYDAIPLNPPPLTNTTPSSVLFGPVPIAGEKGADKASEKISAKKLATEPSSPVVTVNASPSRSSPDGTSMIPDWLKTVFVPRRTHGVLAVAATSLFGGWYGVKSLFPPALTGTSSEQAKAATGEQAKNLFETNGSPNARSSTPATGQAAIPQANSTSTTPQPITPVTGLTLPAVPPSPTGLPIATPAAVATPPTGIQLASHSEPASLQIPIPIPNASGTGSATAAPPMTPPSAVNLPSPSMPAAMPPAATSVPIPVTVPSLPDATAVIPTTAVSAPPSIAVIPSLPGMGESKSATTPIPEPKLDLPKPTSPGSVTLPLPGAATSSPAISLPGVAASTAQPTVTAPMTPTASAPLTITPDMGIRSSPAGTTPSPTPSMLPVGVGAGSSAVTPVASSAVLPGTPTPAGGQAQTDFDVDLHYVKSGESFASIAKQHYGDERFGQALEQFNRRLGFDGRVVQIPPTHWIKKQTGGGRATMPSPAATSNEDWAGIRNNNSIQTIQLDTEKTFRELARVTLGSEQQWERIFNLNPNFSSNAKLPVGTTIRLPADAKVDRR
jgi:hypothetical protein